jgi:SAM-dependent methyltransferase
MSMFGEFILRRLSRDPNDQDYVVDHYERKHGDVSVYEKTLLDTFPNLSEMICKKKVLDVGCAGGLETLALALAGADEVTGIDIRIDTAKTGAIQQKYPENRIRFFDMDAEHTTFPDDSFDTIITCGALEHFADPHAVLRECRRILRSNGRLCLTSGVWAHPWGAHMNFFTMVPWVQFLFSESTIMNVRALYRNDGAKRFHEVEGGLNRIGVRSFQRIVRDLDFQTEHLRLEPVKGLTPLTYIPYVRELFTSLIIAVLRKT